MFNLKGKTSNLLAYFGWQSYNYHQLPTPGAWDESDPAGYYLDVSGKADYNGPFDNNGVPLFEIGARQIYFPTHLCFYALGLVSVSRKTKRPKPDNSFIAVADWLSNNMNDRGCWLTDVDKPKFGLKGPLISAMTQGLGISVLVRAYNLTKDKSYLNSATAALAPFELDIEAGGVTTITDGYKFYEEYPGNPPHHVLNGFIYALFALHDLALTGCERARSLYDDGLKTLATRLPEFDLGYWSLYHIGPAMPNPASYHYHRLHIDQLEVMAQLTDNSVIRSFAKKWRRCFDNKTNGLRTLPAKLRWDLSYKP